MRLCAFRWEERMSPTVQAFRAFLQSDGATILPELELVLFAGGILAMDRWLEAGEKRWNASLALCGLVFSAFTLWTLRGQVAIRSGLYGFRESILIDPYFLFFGAILLVGVAFTVLISAQSPDLGEEKYGRFYALMLIATAAMLLMISSTELLLLFLSLECMALCFYFLANLQRGEDVEGFKRRRAFGGAFLARVFGTLFVAGGFAIVYRLTSTANIGEISMALGQRSDLARAIALAQQPGARGEGMRQLLEARMPQALQHHFFPMQTLPMCALVLVALGVLLKVASASSSRFSGRFPAVALTPVSAFAAITGATASFAWFLRLLLTVFASSQDTWLYIAETAALCLLAGTGLVIVLQRNVRRLLACAELSQFGFLLFGLVSANATGIYGIAFYLFAYVFMLAGLYLVLALLRQGDGAIESTRDLRGLYRRNSTAAILFFIFVLSLAGIPATSGFLGKYWMFKSLIETHRTKLAIAAVILYLPSLFALCRLAAEPFRKPTEEQHHITLTNAQAIALGICLFVTLAAGLYPEPFTRLAHYAFGQ
jgi:NADH-quinone oxidoreductase subunit N